MIMKLNKRMNLRYRKAQDTFDDQVAQKEYMDKILFGKILFVSLAVNLF